MKSCSGHGQNMPVVNQRGDQSGTGGSLGIGLILDKQALKPTGPFGQGIEGTRVGKYSGCLKF